MAWWTNFDSKASLLKFIVSNETAPVAGMGYTCFINAQLLSLKKYYLLGNGLPEFSPTRNNLYAIQFSDRK